MYNLPAICGQTEQSNSSQIKPIPTLFKIRCIKFLGFPLAGCYGYFFLFDTIFKIGNALEFNPKKAFETLI
jgi:hypothetical protein